MSLTAFHDLLRSLSSGKAAVLYLAVDAVPRIRPGPSVPPVTGQAWSATQIRDLVASILPADQSDRYQATGEAVFLHRAPDAGTFNVRVLRTSAESTIVAKPVSDDIPTLETLGLPRKVLESALESNLARRGLMLVAGARGSGRSTSIAAMIGFLNEKVRGRIVTLEDDMRYRHRPGSCMVRQCQLAAAPDARSADLLAAGSAGADLVAIDCAHDVETLGAAIRMAATGVAVIATVDGVNAWAALNAIVTRCAATAGPDLPQQLAAVLTAVTSQKLISRQDGSGHAPAMEVVLNKPAIAHLIGEGKLHGIRSIVEASRSEGMQTIEHALCDLHLTGAISLAEAMRNAESVSTVRLHIKLAQQADRTPDRPDLWIV